LRHPVVLGHVIQRHDLAWKPVAELPQNKAILSDPRSLIGREAARALPEGRALSEQDVKRSLLIKRGDTVTVYSRSGAVTIKTVARASDEGAYGDQISLRTLDTDTTIVAKVIDFHIAEITPELSRPHYKGGGLQVRYVPSAGQQSSQNTTAHTIRTAGVSPRRR
jgi:flagella basal body P-ring formation protein FlgA